MDSVASFRNTRFLMPRDREVAGSNHMSRAQVGVPACATEHDAPQLP